MTFVAARVNTIMLGSPATITDVVDPHERLVAFLRELMAGGLSQQAIADRTGGEVSQSAISSYISGTRRAKLDSAVAIGRAFGKSPDFFTSETLERDDERGAPAVERFIADREAAGRPLAAEAQLALRRTFYKTAEITDALVQHAYESWHARQSDKALERPALNAPKSPIAPLKKRGGSR